MDDIGLILFGCVLDAIGLETERTKPAFPVDLLEEDLAVEGHTIEDKVNADSPQR